MAVAAVNQSELRLSFCLKKPNILLLSDLVCYFHYHSIIGYLIFIAWLMVVGLHLCLYLCTFSLSAPMSLLFNGTQYIDIVTITISSRTMSLHEFKKLETILVSNINVIYFITAT